MDPFLSPKPYLNSSAKRGMLIVLLDDSTTNRLFRNSMERIDRLWYNQGVFLRSFYAITASLNVEERGIAMIA